MKLLRSLVLFLAAAAIASAAPPRPGPTAVAQSGSICGSAAHCVVLTWTASTSAATCTSPCSLGYNVFSGTAAGAEDLSKAVNLTPITGTTFTIPVTLTSTPQTFFFVLQAVETSSGVTASSPSSVEVSASFPGTPSAPTGVTATKQ